MKRVIVYLSALYIFSVYPSCSPPQPGTRVWDIAATALELIITTQSVLDLIVENITVDITGIYTVAAAIDAGVDSANLSLYTINSSLDELVDDIVLTQSKLTILESQLEVISTFIDQLSADIAGTYTALDALEGTIVSSLDLLAVELESVQGVIVDITANSIDHNTTIASQLNVLQLDVNILNSVLDTIDWPNLNTSLDTLSSLLDVLVNNVNRLEDSIEVGFAGTFTVLDAQLYEIDLIESIVENIHVTDITDFSGVFTALAQLDGTVNAIESLVDILTLINAKNTAIAIESLMDLALSHLDSAESKIVQGPSIIDHTISLLEHVELPLLDQASSKLDITIKELNTIESSVDTISSKLNEIIIDDLGNLSKLELIADLSMTTVSILDDVTVPISKLAVVDSQLDTFIMQEFTIESLVDVIFADLVTINSSLDPLISQAELLDSLLAIVENTDIAISSKLDLTLDNLYTVNSTLDKITNISASSLAMLGTIESELDYVESMFDNLALTSIESKLAVTSNLETSVISKLDVVIPFIATLNNEAQGLINDFQATWTILNKINNSLATSQTTLNIIESTLEHLAPHDISTVFTVINTIVRNEATINSQVDVYGSLVDAFNRRLSTDFNGVFTALTAINASEISSSSLLSTISSKLSNIQTEFGFPIYGRNLPLTITTPGRYYLAENITFLPTIAGNSAIYISVNDVSLDLNGRMLSQNTGSALLTDGIYNFNTLNTRIFNGSISNFQGYGVTCNSCTNVLMRDINAFNNGLGAGSNINFGTAVIRNIVADNCVASNPSIFTGFKLQGPSDLSANNVLIKNCRALNTGAGAANFSGGLGILYTNNVVIQNSIAAFNQTPGIRCGIGQNILVDNCISVSNGFSQVNRRCAGILIETNNPAGTGNRGIGGVVKNCIVQDNYNGIVLFASASSLQDSVVMNNYIVDNTLSGVEISNLTLNQAVNNVILFNTCMQNSTNIDELSSPGINTYLGNFAFNSSAVGNPNNSNYTMTSSNITGKFSTASQRGSFGDFPDKWHNINMLP